MKYNISNSFIEKMGLTSRMLRKTFMKKNSAGFTLIELIVCVIIIAILASVSVIGYNKWNESINRSKIETDLRQAASSMENYKSNNNSYPDSLPESFEPSEGVTVEVFFIGDNSFCLDARMTNVSTAYHIEKQDGRLGGLLTGNCASVHPQSPVMVAFGYRHSCAILFNKKAYCWGENVSGQLGNSSNTQSLVPVAVNTSGVLNNKMITSIASAGYHTCVIASDEGMPNYQVYCWGRNDFGQLGNNSTTNSSVPVAVNTSGVLNGKTIKSIAVGHMHTCAIASDNKVYCWGRGGSGDLGNNSTTNSSVPVAVYTAGVLNGKTIKSLTAGNYHNCVIASDDLVYCWGNGNDGQLGNNAFVDSLVPVAVNRTGALSGKTIKSIASGGDHVCVIASDGLLYCWGNNWNGRLGNNSETNSAIPVAVVMSGAFSGKTIKSIAGGNGNSCAIASDNQPYCWGHNGSGQLGNNTTNFSLVPTPVDKSGILNGRITKMIGSGGDHVCLIAETPLAYDGQVVCWGSNANGQLGNNSTTNSLIPIGVMWL